LSLEMKEIVRLTARGALESSSPLFAELRDRDLCLVCICLEMMRCLDDFAGETDKIIFHLCREFVTLFVTRKSRK